MVAAGGTKNQKKGGKSGGIKKGRGFTERVMNRNSLQILSHLLLNKNNLTPLDKTPSAPKILFWLLFL